eukprot:6956764-Alexandrium_andersonii.AAC.1
MQANPQVMSPTPDQQLDALLAEHYARQAAAQAAAQQVVAAQQGASAWHGGSYGMPSAVADQQRAQFAFAFPSPTEPPASRT